MPIYTYKCFYSDCGYIFEINHGMNENIVICEKCNNNTIKKIPSQVIIMKNNSEKKTLNKKEKYRESCEESKEILKSQKEDLKNRVWEK